MSSLPIESIRSTFESSLQTRSPLVVVSPTGSGKSTQLPLWLADHVQGKVLVVEPRRVACKALATFVSKTLKQEVGGKVGFRVRFDSQVSAATRVEFVTPGVALRLLHGSDGNDYDAVMLDEFHERHWEVDLLAMLLLAELKNNPQRKLVLTSATLAGKELAEQIDGRLLEADGRSYPVQLSHSGQVSGPTPRDLEARVEEAVTSVLRSSDPVDQGDILVFLPGKREIGACRQQLEPMARRHGMVLVPVHADLPSKELSRALDGTIQERKIYLATNVAETSLTLPGVTVVMDSGLARMRIHRRGRSALALVPIPLALMEQRKGRAGRVAPGHCIRLWQESFRPEATLKPEVERIELDDLLIQAGAHGFDGSRFREAPWVTPPPDFAIEEARERLHRMSALDSKGCLTEAGDELADWPVSAQEASFLVGAPEPLLGVLCDLVAVLQLRGSFLSPLHRFSSKDMEAIVDERKELLGHCKDEVSLELTCLRSGNVEKHGLRRRALQQARSIASQLRRRSRLAVIQPTQDSSPLPTTEELATWILQRNPDFGFVLRQRAKNAEKRPNKRGRESTQQPWANDEMEVLVEPFVPLLDDENYKPPQAGLIFRHAWIGGVGLRIIGKGEMVLPCSLQTLAEAGLGEQQWSEPQVQRAGSRKRVVAHLCQTLAGVDLVREERDLKGEALCRALASLSFHGQWSPKWAAAVLDAAHLLKVLHEWPSMDKTWNSLPDSQHIWTDPEAFLARTFRELGVEHLEDVSLLEVSDVVPPMEEWCGLDSYTLSQWVDDFPRVWEFQGATYECHAFPRKRTVVMEPANGAASKKKEPNGKLLPRFRNFQVEFKKASRRVVLRKR